MPSLRRVSMMHSDALIGDIVQQLTPLPIGSRLKFTGCLKDFCRTSRPLHRPLLDVVKRYETSDHHSSLYSHLLLQSRLKSLMMQYLPNVKCMNSYLPEATAEDVVRSSRLRDDEHPSRSLLETGIVDERQISIWPEFCENAHTGIHP